MSDAITILCARGRRLAKLIRADGTIDGYDSARTFDLAVRQVPDLDALHRLLAALLHRPDCCIVRGAPLDPARCRGVRRMLHPDPETGDAATLREVPHRWCALDLDGIARPEAVPAYDLAGCAHIAIDTLPDPFRAARCIAQASASHGIAPGCRLRLWYWLSRPTSGTELTRWLRGSPADPAIFRAAQIIYTAAPIFARGGDHLPRRMIEGAGDEMVQVPAEEALQPPPPRPAKPLPHPTETRANRYAFAALRNAATRITTAPVGQRHRSIIREARGLARFAEAGLIAEAELHRVLADAAAAAGKPGGETEAAIAWAIAHPRAGSMPAAAT